MSIITQWVDYLRIVWQFRMLPKSLNHERRRECLSRSRTLEAFSIQTKVWVNIESDKENYQAIPRLKYSLIFHDKLAFVEFVITHYGFFYNFRYPLD